MAQQKDVTRPLVAVVGGGTYIWVENGVGWILSGGKWLPLTEAPGIGGWVLAASQIEALQHSYGRPAADDSQAVAS